VTELDTRTRGPAVVAFGGGHGLACSLAALRRLTARLTAVVTVADDGGSSGRLRGELGVLPPGDLRMALVALAGERPPAIEWATVAQHRFAGAGPLAGHPVGNLMLAGLAEVTGDPVAALDAMARLLGAAGRVLPLSPEPLDIVARVVGLDPADPAAVHEVRGQVAVATTTGQVVGVSLVPAEPAACKEAIEAVADADWLVFGPGSWFTSVIPHLLVPDVLRAVESSAARRVLSLNLAPQPGETAGFSPEAHLDALAAHAPDMSFDVVLADERSLPAGTATRLGEVAAGLGARLVLADVARADGSPRHDEAKLAETYRSVFAEMGRREAGC
jgi:uncharacterized cofD-like protein